MRLNVRKSVLGMRFMDKMECVTSRLTRAPPPINQYAFSCSLVTSTPDLWVACDVCWASGACDTSGKAVTPQLCIRCKPAGCHLFLWAPAGAKWSCK